jgi:hypothetical protein
MRVLVPAIAALLGAGAARMPLNVRLLELEYRVERLEEELELRKTASDDCHEDVVLFGEYTNSALTEIRTAINRLHGLSSPLVGDRPSNALGAFSILDLGCTPRAGRVKSNDAGTPTPRDAGRP